jgi:ethanolamine utilization cobalamin adenosyltransferase
MCATDKVILLPAADEERGRATLARCARILLSLVEVDLRAIGEAPKRYLVEHHQVDEGGTGKTAQRISAYRETMRQRRRTKGSP